MLNTIYIALVLVWAIYQQLTIHNVTFSFFSMDSDESTIIKVYSKAIGLVAAPAIEKYLCILNSVITMGSYADFLINVYSAIYATVTCTSCRMLLLALHRIDLHRGTEGPRHKFLSTVTKKKDIVHLFSLFFQQSDNLAKELLPAAPCKARISLHDLLNALPVDVLVYSAVDALAGTAVDLQILLHLVGEPKEDNPQQIKLSQV